MKITQLILPVFALSGALFLSSCAEDPSESVPSAGVSEAVEAESSPAPVAPAAETPAASDPVIYAFTDESKIGFVGSKVTGSHEGGFEKFSGTFQIAGDQPGPGPHTIEIDMNSVWSDAEKLTGHLKSPDFFDVEKFPTATFNLTSAEPAEGADTFTITGEFTLHGVTKTITFPAKITNEAGTAHLNAEFSINRKDFGIVYAGKADDLIRDGVVIKLAMVAKPQA